MKAIFVSIAKKIGYLIAIIIILIALLVSVSRFLTPALEKHRTDFEQWASQLAGTPVTIDNVEVSWYQYQPGIRFRKVIIHNKDNQEPIFQIQSVRVFISLFQSLWQWKIVPSSIMISGTSVSLNQASNGEFSIQGFAGNFANQPFKQEASINNVIGWLSLQPQLVLRNIDVRLTQSTGEKRIITLFNLIFKNNGDTHIILGKAVLQQELPLEVSTAIEWIGTVGTEMDLSKIKARMYVYVSGFSLTQWLKDKIWQGWQTKDGIVSAKIWASWNHNAFQRMQTEFQLYNLSLFSQTDKSTHVVNRLSGSLGWKKDKNGQEIFAGDDILIDLPSHLWPVTSFYAAFTKNANGEWTPQAMNLGYVNLSDIQPFIFSSPAFLPETIQKTLPQLKLKGALENTAITFSGPWKERKNISLSANFSSLGISAWQKYPGINNLSGLIKWNGTEGDASLNSVRAELQYDSIFANPIILQQLTGEVHFKQDANQNWIMNVPAMSILNSDLAANVQGSLTIPADKSPSIDLEGHFTMQRANRINRYLPLRIFDPSLVKWLRSAFLTGEVQSGTAKLKGVLSDFPFANNNGTFLISGIVNNVTLNYAPDWPLLKEITATLTFAGHKMTISASHALIQNIPLSNVQAEIGYLGSDKPAILTVQSAPIQADFSQGLAFVHASPLEQTIGKMFKGVELQGPITLKLGLVIPLDNTDKTEVNGDINFKNALMNLVPWNLSITNLQGLLHFTESTTDANNIQGQLFNKPLTLNITTLHKTKDLSIVQANFSHHLDIADIEKWLNIPFAKVIQGSSDVTGSIDFSLTEPLQIHLQSNLVGMTVKLPNEYAKQPTVARDFTGDITVQDSQLRVQLRYGDLLGAALLLNKKQDQFTLTAVTLQLGKGVAPWPEKPGLYITGEFPTLNWDQIKNYVNQSQSSSSNFTTLPLRGVDISAQVLNILGQSLHQVRLQVQPMQTDWDVDIDSTEVIGELKVPVNITPQGVVTANFKRINLKTNQSNANQKNAINPSSLPSIIFAASNVSYNDMPFGVVTFRTSPSANGLNIENLKIASNYLNLQASGEWKGNNTSLQGTATSTNVSALLNSFGLDVHNFVSSTGRMNFNVGWSDAPYAFSMSNLSGDASLELGRGRIVDVGQQGGAKMELGKLLSIFSLQTIPRRLMFDFSDVFQKGYSFDSLKGNFNFRNGNAYTNNLRFEGSVARVDISGRIGLKARDLDINLGVTPYVTSSLPVAATLATIGNPAIGIATGVAALIANTVIGGEVSKASNYTYKVSGPWSNPVWETNSNSNKR